MCPSYIAGRVTRGVETLMPDFAGFTTLIVSVVAVGQLPA